MITNKRFEQAVSVKGKAGIVHHPASMLPVSDYAPLITSPSPPPYTEDRRYEYTSSNKVLDEAPLIVISLVSASQREMLTEVLFL